jgi:hypothetical protein
MISSVSYNITICSPLKVSRLCRGTCFAHLTGLIASLTENQHRASRNRSPIAIAVRAQVPTNPILSYPILSYPILSNHNPSSIMVAVYHCGHKFESYLGFGCKSAFCYYIPLLYIGL